MSEPYDTVGNYKSLEKQLSRVFQLLTCIKETLVILFEDLLCSNFIGKKVLLSNKEIWRNHLCILQEQQKKSWNERKKNNRRYEKIYSASCSKDSRGGQGTRPCINHCIAETCVCLESYDSYIFISFLLFAGALHGIPLMMMIVGHLLGCCCRLLLRQTPSWG